MTDRSGAFLVHLDDDYRIGDGEEYVGIDRMKTAIEMIKGVTKVEPVPSDYQDHLARERVRMELRKEMRDVLWPKRSS